MFLSQAWDTPWWLCPCWLPSTTMSSSASVCSTSSPLSPVTSHGLTVATTGIPFTAARTDLVSSLFDSWLFPLIYLMGFTLQFRISLLTPAPNPDGNGSLADNSTMENATMHDTDTERWFFSIVANTTVFGKPRAPAVEYWE